MRERYTLDMCLFCDGEKQSYYNQLRKYEDTCLTPDEIMELVIRVVPAVMPPPDEGYDMKDHFINFEKYLLIYEDMTFGEYVGKDPDLQVVIYDRYMVYSEKKVQKKKKKKSS